VRFFCSQSLVSTPSPSQWAMAVLSPEVKLPEHEVEKSPPPPGAEVKSGRSYSFNPSACLHDVHRDNMTCICLYETELCDGKMLDVTDW
jgi:hypothetical protein